VVGGFMYKK